jgi:hypothetical protein
MLMDAIAPASGQDGHRDPDHSDDRRRCADWGRPSDWWPQCGPANEYPCWPRRLSFDGPEDTDFCDTFPVALAL